MTLLSPLIIKTLTQLRVSLTSVRSRGTVLFLVFLLRFTDDTSYSHCLKVISLKLDFSKGMANSFSDFLKIDFSQEMENVEVQNG